MVLKGKGPLHATVWLPPTLTSPIPSSYATGYLYGYPGIQVKGALPGQGLSRKFSGFSLVDVFGIQLGLIKRQCFKKYLCTALNILNLYLAHFLHLLFECIYLLI